MALELVAGGALVKTGTGEGRSVGAGEVLEDIVDTFQRALMSPSASTRPAIQRALAAVDRRCRFWVQNDRLYATCVIPRRSGDPFTFQACIPLAPIRDALAARMQNRPGWSLKSAWKSIKRGAQKIAKGKMFKMIVKSLKDPRMYFDPIRQTQFAMKITPQAAKFALKNPELALAVAAPFTGGASLALMPAMKAALKSAGPLLPLAKQIAANAPAIVSVVSAASKPDAPNHSVAVDAIERIGAMATTNSDAASVLAKMRVVNRVRLAASIRMRASLGDLFARSRARVTEQAKAAPPAERDEMLRGAAAILARLARLETRVTAQIPAPAPMPEIAPPGALEIDARVAGWAWNVPYRGTGGMRRLRGLYHAGLVARA